MKPHWLISGALVSFLACGSNVDQQTSTSTGTGGSACETDGGSAHFPVSTTTPGCPPTPDVSTCTQQGQVCTWTTGKSSATYTCQMVADCSPMTYVEWSNPAVTGDGCAGSACCVPCAAAKLDDPCDALGYQCPYSDNLGEFPPWIGLYCTANVWVGIPECEN